MGHTANAAGGEYVIEGRSSCEGLELKIDRENSVIRGVKILGATSKNGRDYSREAMEGARGLYERALANVDHPKKPTDSRSYLDRVGHFEGVRLGEGPALFADFHLNPKHPVAEAIFYDAEHAPHRLGFSPNHAIRTRPGANGRKVVESITHVLSVDLVADPATTGGIFEHVETEESVVELTLESLKKDHPALVTAILDDAKAGEGMKALESENKTLKAKIDAIEAKNALEARKAAVEAKIVAAKFPEGSVSDTFRGLCLEAKDDAAVDALIADRKAIVGEGVAKRPTSKPKSKDQGVTESRDDAKLPEVTDGESFARSITG